MKYEAENLRDILEELKPLLKEHWEEVAWYKDKIKLKPDYEKYLGMEDQDKLLVIKDFFSGKESSNTRKLSSFSKDEGQSQAEDAGPS